MAGKPVPVTAHMYIPDGIPTFPGRDCGCARCPLPKRHPVHDVTVPDPDVAAVQDRMVGDR